MISMEGCRDRRQRLIERLGLKHRLLLADPIHLRYLANFHVDPFSLGGDFGGLLAIDPDGTTKLFHDNRLPGSVEEAHVDERIPIVWYDGKSPGLGDRRQILSQTVMNAGTDHRIHDQLNDPLANDIFRAISSLRRSKDPDEIKVLKECMRLGEIGQKWAREHVGPGMKEIEVYAGIAQTCCLAAGFPVIVYGDFAVSPGSSRRGGPATSRVIQEGDTLILDFSVILRGYRSDFTNTLVVGGHPNSQQVELFEQCLSALKAGEAKLAAHVPCIEVYESVRGAFRKVGRDSSFPHHAGHGLGLSHPEAPFFVVNATETLQVGDVVTLEPGLYIDGIGGIRIEHNYLITSTGFERLSHHELSLN